MPLALAHSLSTTMNGAVTVRATNAGSGAASSKTTVRSSRHSTLPSMALQYSAYSASLAPSPSAARAFASVPSSASAMIHTLEFAGLTTSARSTEYSTSRQVRGLPLWKVTPSRRWKVKVRASSETW